MSSSSVIQLPSSHNLYAVKVTSTGDLPWRSQNYGSESSERSKLQIVERQYGTSNSEHTRIPHLQHADESKQLSGHIIPKLFGEKAKKEVGIESSKKEKCFSEVFLYQRKLIFSQGWPAGKMR